MPSLWAILAPHHAWRWQIVPRVEEETSTAQGDETHEAERPRPSAAQRLTWAELLKRVFQIDLTVCPDCGGTLKFVAAIVDPTVVRTILEHVGLPADPPPILRRNPSDS